MRLRSIAALAAVALLALSACRPASAQTASCYVGASAGATAHNIDIGVTGLGSLSGIGGDGYSLAGIGGCDLRAQGFVFGLMADAAWQNSESSLAFGPIAASVTLDATYTIAGRIGYDVTKSLTPYIMVGYTWGQASASFAAVPDLEGLTVGGGLDVALDANWLIRAEYRMTRFDDIGAAPLVIEPTVHEARVGILYRFSLDAPK